MFLKKTGLPCSCKQIYPDLTDPNGVPRKFFVCDILSFQSFDHGINERTSSPFK